MLAFAYCEDYNMQALFIVYYCRLGWFQSCIFSLKLYASLNAFHFSSFGCSDFFQDWWWLCRPISNGSLDKIIFIITIWMPDLADFHKPLPVKWKKKIWACFTNKLFSSITWAWKSGKDSNLFTSVSVPLSCLFSVEHASSFPVLFSASLASSSFLHCHFHTAIIILFQV